MLHIVGGTYHEFCQEGDWQQFFGSGLRAAATLVALSGGTKLSTYMSKRDLSLAEIAATTFKVELDHHMVERAVQFKYTHGLAVPLIFPPPGVFQSPDAIHVQAEHILRFGMIEGDAVVAGDRVVYDPQSAYNPQRFAANGSRAGRLAIVCNVREARLLAGELNPYDAGMTLLATEGAEVVVLKSGSRGALVFHKSGTHRISPCRTERVWPIGSGDVFAAVFAHCWAELDLAPVVSAQHASTATAEYCENRTLPIQRLPTSYRGIESQVEAVSNAREGAEHPLVYLAGPFFHMMERWIIGEARDALLDQGIRVFSPLHDVGRGEADDVVPRDIEAIRESNAMLAVLDNLDPGTLFEIGFARSIGKPVVVFAQNVSAGDLKMMEGTECIICDDFVTAIYKTVWTAGG